MFMKDVATPRVHSDTATARVLTSVLLEVFKHGKAEAKDPFVRLRQGWQRFRPSWTEYFVNATSQQLVLVTEMSIESRSANVGASQNFLYDD